MIQHWSAAFRAGVVAGSANSAVAGATPGINAVQERLFTVRGGGLAPAATWSRETVRSRATDTAIPSLSPRRERIALRAGCLKSRTAITPAIRRPEGNASEVLNVNAGVPNTDFVADLTHGEGVPDAAFDCVILTQTLHLIFDVSAAIRTLHRILKPGGSLLLTVPGTISQIEGGEWRSVWYWGFTRLSLERLFAGSFPNSHIAMTEYGNVLTSIAFLEGLVAEEFTAAELGYRDELYPLLLGLRATRAP